MSGRVKAPRELGRLLTVEEVAERLRVSVNAIHQAVYRDSAPPSVRVGRRRLFPERLLEEWIADRLDT